MADKTEKKLFKYYLDQKESRHNSRPEFIYRRNRKIFNTLVRRPVSFFAPFYMMNGWGFKGAVAAVIYFYLFQKQPIVKHWNRQGYEYEKEHKTSGVSQV